MKKILIVLMLISTFISYVMAEDNETTWINGKLVAIYNNAYSIQKPQENVQYSLKITKIKSISLDMSQLTQKWQELLGKNVEIKVNKSNTSSHKSYLVLEIRYSPTIQNTNLKNALTQEESQKPWINILCKFSDIATEPQESAYYQNIFANTYPYLEHYWKDISYGKIDISGTQTRDTWVTLAENRSYYVNGSDVNLNALATDCLASSGLTTNELDNYFGVNFFFNGSLGGSSWGGGGYTYIAESHSKYLGLIAHEMGHGYGLSHSSGRYGDSYDSPWDIMSGGGDNKPYGVYYDAPIDTIAFYKQKLGLININAQWNNIAFDATLSSTIHLSRLEEEAEEGNYLIANIYSADGSKHYSVEARDRIGYDSPIPAKAVIIHEVENNSRAYIVDEDNNGDVSDAGVQWQVGETFSDNSNGISVEILSQTATGYNIRLTAPKAKPNSVINILATDTLTDKVRITWSPSSGAEYYKVLRYDSWDINSASQSFTTANSDTYYDDFVNSFSQYYYRIEACNTGGCSSVSLYEYDTGKRNFIINASDGLYSDKVTVSYPTLPSFVSRFTLWRGLEDSNSYAYISDSSPLVDTSAQRNVKYNYWMTLYDANDNQVGSSFDIGYKAWDTDNDGVADKDDPFPNNANEWLDTDNDGVGNNSDTDDDNDGILDLNDAFPNNDNESIDTDNDGIGNNSDTDDDNDGILDSNDAFPTNPNESVDTDNDGIGNNSDSDDDDDGISDSVEIANGLNPLLASDASADFDSDGFSNALEIKLGTNIRNAKSKPKWTPIVMGGIIIIVATKP